MKKVFILFCAVIFFTPNSVFAAILNVPGDYNNIQAAVNAAMDGDVVSIADGIYSGSGNFNINFVGRSITVKSVNGADNCIIDCQGWGRGVLLYRGETVTLEGLTVKNAQATNENGGGVYCKDSVLIVTGCIFVNGFSGKGGAVYSENSFAFFTDSRFTNNAADQGGAVYSKSLSSCYFTNSVFSGNIADIGGATFSYGSSSSFTGCTLSDNQALNGRGGAVYSYQTTSSDPVSSSFANCNFSNNQTTNGEGGAVYVYSGSAGSTLSISRCEFAGNQAGSYSGGALYFNYLTQTAISESKFMGNQAANGGAIYARYSSHNNSFSRCVFIGNSASYDGGGVFSNLRSYTGGAEFSNCLFINNSADQGRGGAVFSSPESDNYYRDSFANCTFSTNSAASRGGALWCDLNAVPSQANIVNSIFWNNNAPEGPEIYAYGNSPEIIYSDIRGGYSGTGNIDSDPLFVDSSNNDFHLQASSPCVNTATPDGAPGDDLDGNKRPVDGVYDMGAYEYCPNISPTAVAGDDQIVPGQSATLDGSLSRDPDGNIVSWEWKLEHTENPAYNRLVYGKTVSLDNLAFGHYNVTLTVTDDAGAQVSDEMCLSVAASDLKYTQDEYDQAFQNGYTTGYNECQAACPIWEDGDGVKHLEGPLTIENKGLLIIQ
jgi:hypothetical protein